MVQKEIEMEEENSEAIMKIMRHRRSVRVYTTEAVSGEDIEKIIEAGANAPTGDNFKTTRFIVIRDKAMLTKMAESRKMGARMLKGANAAIVVLGNAGKSDLWVEDCSIAAAYMHLTADALGLGSCWIQVRARDAADGSELEDYLRQMSGFPSEIKPLCILSIGHTDNHPAGHTKDEIAPSRIHSEKWQSDRNEVTMNV